jgi:hypothetical protein
MKEKRSRKSKVIPTLLGEGDLGFRNENFTS